MSFLLLTRTQRGIGDCLIALEVPNDARAPDDYAQGATRTRNVWKKILWRRPPGAAAPGGGGIFSNMLKAEPFSQSIWKKRPSIFFRICITICFQITIIYKGTQVTSFLSDFEFVNKAHMFNYEQHLDGI